MSALENFINSLSDEELEYLEKTVFDDGNVIPLEQLDAILDEEETLRSQYDAVQYALKINLNSVYGVQIMPHFKFADEWQALGASTTLTGRILSKYGLIEAIEQYFNPERESRFEFPLLDNIVVAADHEPHYQDPQNQKLRSAVISDTDSVSGDSVIKTNQFGEIKIEQLVKESSRVEYKDNKEFYFFDDENLSVMNYVDGQNKMDTVEFIYAHKCDKQMYEIELEDGKTIKVTEDHSIMVLDQNGEPTIEKKPFELTEDDICVVL